MKTLRKRILQQSYKLKGTKIWIAEELTRTQLKNIATKLAKVRAAREAGKWAVYCDGLAVIRDFKTTEKPKDPQS